MTSRRLRFLAGSVVIAFACYGPARADGLSDDAKTFLSVVRTNFAAWDTSHKGRLTFAEIEMAMQNPAYTGDAGAALAALMWAAKPNKANPEPRSYTLADFDAIEKTLADGEKPDHNYVKTFTGGQKKIAKENRDLFADKIPHIDAIRQTKDVDCYFHSAVGAIANEKPELIVKLIHKNADASFTVTFPRHAPEKLPAPTDAEIAAYTNSSDGIWFNLLEKAYGKIRKIDHVTDEPINAAALHGGGTSEIIKLMTAHATKNIKFPADGQSADKKFLNQVRDEVAAAFDAHLAVTTGKSHHAYAVISFDRATDMFTLHNPWDSKGREKFDDGETEPRDEKGFFSLTTAEFVEHFKNIVIEEPQLASK